MSTSTLSTAERRTGYLLSVDPGLRATGLALWKDGVLLHAGAVRGPPPPARGPAVWSQLATDVHDHLRTHNPGAYFIDGRVIVETMRYDHGSKKGSAEDLLEVQGVGGAVVGRFAAHGWDADEAPAHVWKGQVPRDVMAGRVEAWVKERGWWDRVVLYTRATENNDTMHAVGIGRWWLRL
jgi:hypothetical protein